MTNPVGQQLGNYRLIRLIGSGGFGEVYLGEHIYLKMQAAIKILHTQLTSEEMQAFINEGKTIALLRHPNIVSVLDFGVDSSTPFLVMDYAPNGTLRHRHPEGTKVALGTVVSYVKQIADALQYAHDLRLIHRDVKPENMFVGRKNEVLLGDFGIAAIIQDSDSDTTHDRVGTLDYMAPEQIKGKPSAASDQYALGIVAYEWLTGEHPFHGSFVEIATKHMFELPTPLREKMPSLSSDVEQVVMTALAKDPRQRFLNIQDFANAFEQACQIQNYPYDVAISYAGEDRNYANSLADVLRQRGVKVFYDKYEKAILWGEDLYSYLSDLYQNKAHYCVLFLSKHFAAKLWTKHELKAAQARALKEQNVYILPVRLDDTEIPGLLPTIAYLNWHQETVETIADAIMGKLGKSKPNREQKGWEFDPDNPDNFFSGQ